MNCPRCGAENVSSRLYCSACGASLTRPLSETSSKKRRSFHAKTVLWIVAVIAINLAGCVLSVTQNSPGLFFLLLAVDVFAASAALWRQGFHATAVTIGMTVVTVAVMVLVGNLYSRFDTKRRQDRLEQQHKDLQALAQTWGSGVMACDPLPRNDIVARQGFVPDTTPREILLIESPNVSSWQALLPADEQPPTSAEVNWVVCLVPQEIDSKCRYDGGVSLSYYYTLLDIRLYYVGDGRLEFLGGTQLAGSLEESCPPSVHTVNGGIDYVIMADGSHKSPSELHLDQTVSFDRAYEQIAQMIENKTQ